MIEPRTFPKAGEVWFSYEGERLIIAGVGTLVDTQDDVVIYRLASDLLDDKLDKKKLTVHPLSDFMGKGVVSENGERFYFYSKV